MTMGATKLCIGLLDRQQRTMEHRKTRCNVRVETGRRLAQVCGRGHGRRAERAAEARGHRLEVRGHSTTQQTADRGTDYTIVYKRSDADAMVGSHKGRRKQPVRAAAGREGRRIYVEPETRATDNRASDRQRG